MIQTKAFNNSILDIFGFTGYSPDDNAIIVTFRSTVSVQNWVVNLDATQVLVFLLRFLILDAQDARSIKVFTMLLWELKVTSEVKFKNYWHCIEMLKYMQLATAWDRLSLPSLASISTIYLAIAINYILMESLEWVTRTLPVM